MLDTTRSQARRVAATYLQETFTEQTPTRTHDAYAHEVFSYATVRVVRGQLVSVNAAEREIIAASVNDGSEISQTAKLNLPYGTFIDKNNVILAPNGERWNIAKVIHSPDVVYAVCLLWTKAYEQ